MRERLEKGFAQWGRFAYRHAWVVIGLVLACTVSLATQLPKIGFDTSTEGFFNEEDPVRVTYDAFRREFGQDTMILLAIRSDEVFTLETLERLRSLHEDIESEVPLLVEVTSLVNARETLGLEDRLRVDDFLLDWPETPAEALEVRRRALANPLYLDNFVSADAEFTSIVIEIETYSRSGMETDDLGGFDDDGETGGSNAASDAGKQLWLTGDEIGTIVTSLFEVVERHQADDFEIAVSGSPVFVNQFQVAMQRDMARFASLAVLMIAVLLGALFRRTAGVVLPLVTVVSSLITTISIMAISGTPLMLPTQILPSFLLAVGVGGSVHILAIFYQARRRGENREDAIAYALGHSGLAVLMTSLTTAVGLVSFAAAQMRPIAHFGIFAPVGVMVALVFTAVLLPALIAVFPMREEREGALGRRAFSQRLLLRAGDFAVRRAGAVAAVWALLLVAAGFGATQVHLSHDPISWWPEGHPMRAATELMNEKTGGAMFFEMLVETGVENGMHDPELLASLETLGERAAEIDMGRAYVGKTVSLVDVVKEIHQALNENRQEFRAVPASRDLVAQELLLFENSGSDDLDKFVDPSFATGGVTFKAPFVDSTGYPALLAAISAQAESLLGSVPFHITGMGVVMTNMINGVMNTLVRSYILALLLVLPFLVLLIGNLRMGLTAIIPNLAPIVMTLGVMGWFGIGIDIFTLLIGCIAISLAVDDTIHFMHNFRRYYDATGDVRMAVRSTLETTGQALLFTSLVLALGFLLYTFAEMRVLFHFGFLTAFTIMMAFLADLILAPALLVLVTGAREVQPAQALEMEATQ
jgi:predicted RND superfamily exporter protein